jgi:hypothetical protein
LFLRDYGETVRAIAWKLREIVVEVLPDLNEDVTGHKNISYSTDAGPMKGGIAYIAPYKDSVNLGFMDGVDLPDPQGLLKGTGKRLRHIKFTSPEQVDDHAEDIRSLLKAAKALKT